MSVRWFVLPLVLLVLSAASLFAQDTTAWHDTLNRLDDSEAKLLIPKHYERAQSAVQSALQDIRKGKQDRRIERSASNAKQALQAAQDALERAQQALSSVQTARKDALFAHADSLAPRLLENAEKSLDQAVSSLEQDKPDRATPHVKDAETLFRDAELKAIKATMLGEARSEIDRAVTYGAELYAPRTLREARAHVDSASAVLDSSRYQFSSAHIHAAAAEYHAAQAYWIATNAQFYNQIDSGFELFVREQEELIDLLADALEYDGAYDEGFEYPVSEMVILASRKSTGRAETIQALRDSLATLQTQMEKIQRTLAVTRDETSQPSPQAAESKPATAPSSKDRVEIEARIDLIRSWFDEDEAEVVLLNNDLIIRLISLDFEMGKDTLPPGTNALIDKVLQACREFQGHRIMVEGHTDSYGRRATNKRLSEERAVAFMKRMLQRAQGFTMQIDFIGKGEMEPIYSNNTKAGRAKNRRIDIVIRDVF
ncbi:OmpA family protein [bacterium]|nr:OmpA family protein [bacterium]